MRHLFILLLSIVSLTPVKTRAQGIAQEKDSELELFIQKFMSAANNRNVDSVMMMMDPAYKMEQHDRFLKGNTKQFLNELFCGNLTDGSGFKCVKFKKIRFVQLASLGQGEKTIPVVFRVHDKKSKVDVILTIAIRMDGTQRMFGVVGGVG